MLRSSPQPRRLAGLAMAIVGGALLAGVVVAGAIGPAKALEEPPHSAELDAAIVRAAKRHNVPESLIRRIIMRESKYVANARNRAYWGLMQISVPTARSMGFRGSPEQLLNPFVNLQYAVPYLANAFVAAGKQQEAAVRLYAAGYYGTAKSRGVLGLLRTADSTPLNGVQDAPTAVPVAAAGTDSGWSLFGSGTPAPAQPDAAQAVQQPVAQQQLAYAAAPEGVAVAPGQAQIQAIAPAAPARGKATGRVATSDKNAGGDVDMVAGRDGAMAPPKRWQHDGGTTVMARGEQVAEATAASRLGGAEAAPGRHARKSAVFAQLEPGPAGAAPTATDAQAAGFFAAAPSPSPAAPSPEVAPSQQPNAAGQQQQASATVAAPDETAASGKQRRRHRHKSDDK